MYCTCTVLYSGGGGGCVIRTPMLRVGEVDEVSGVVAFLCSRAAGYVTGQTISIDGGFSVSGFGYFPGFEIPKL